VLVDTHCHLADPAFDAEREVVLGRARSAGIGHVVAVGESPERAAVAMGLARRIPGVSATAGVHPHEAAAWSSEAEVWVDRSLADPVVVAAGEMGLDYHYDFAPRDRQREAFEAQMALAARHGLPAVIHAREADADVAAVLRNHPATVAVLHSFSSGLPLLETALELGHYVSWSGMITFKNWQNDGQIRRVPLDRLLVETDAPYLAPVPYRGKRNEPAFVAETARRLAQVIGCSAEEVVSLTTENAVRVFGPRLRQSLEVVP
jgi:TatD DNase family protein